MNIKPILALAAGLALGTAMPAQDEAQDGYIAKRNAKLNSPFLKNGDWITDYDQALAAAKESGKPIFGYFTRSYSP